MEPGTDDVDVGGLTVVVTLTVLVGTTVLVGGAEVAVTVTVTVTTWASAAKGSAMREIRAHFMFEDEMVLWRC